MKTETPKRWYRWISSDWVQILNRYLRIFFINKNESEVDHSTYNFPSYIVLLISGWFYDIHSVGTSEIVDVKRVAVVSEQIKGEISVGLVTFSVVDVAVVISVENGPFSIFLSEALLESLSDPVDIIACYLSSDL